MNLLRIVLLIALIGALISGRPLDRSVSGQVRSKGVDPEWANKLRDAPAAGIFSHGLSRQLFLTIYSMATSNRYAGTVFAPNGGWIIVPSNGGYSVSGLPPGASAGLKSLPHDNITQAAVSPNGGWLYVYGVNEKEFKSNNLPERMLKKLQDLYNDHPPDSGGAGKFRTQNWLYQVTFAPNGGWLILYGRDVSKNMFNRKSVCMAAHEDLPAPIEKTIEEVVGRGECVKKAAFAPNGGYLILYGRNGYTYDQIPEQALSILADLKKKGTLITDAAFGPKGSWLIHTCVRCNYK